MRSVGTLAVGVVALTVALIPAPAGAAPNDDTIVTFIVAAGSLNIVAPAGPISVGSAAPGATATGHIGPVTVDDSRGAADASWGVAVTSTDPTAPGPLTIPATEVDYWSGPATATTGNGTFTPGQATAADAEPLDNAAPPSAFTHTGGTGGNTATWNPTLVVNVPLDSQAGTYTATVTHSVA